MKRLIYVLIFVTWAIAALSGCGVAGNPVTAPTSEDVTPVESETISTAPLSKTENAQLENDDAGDTLLEKTPADSLPQRPQQGSEASAPAVSNPVDGVPTPDQTNASANPLSQTNNPQPGTTEPQPMVISQMTALESDFSSASFSGDDKFEEFLSQGGASSDAEVTQFLTSKLLADVAVNGTSFGCSTLAASSLDGHRLFGRNFDWQACNALVVTAKPTNGYTSISTVNLGFISQNSGALGNALDQNDVRVLAALYTPLEAMNEKGLAVSVNMIQDSTSISQSTDKPDLTTTTVVRLLLNRAANVDEALALLREYDLHASMGMMIHFALADTTGRAVVVEYIDNQMVVTETPVVTNFYLAEGAKHGIGTQQSHERYDILTQALADHPTMTMEDVRDAMDSVSKDNFNEFESTEWTTVFDLHSGAAHYYTNHQQNIYSYHSRKAVQRASSKEETAGRIFLKKRFSQAQKCSIGLSSGE